MNLRCCSGSRRPIFRRCGRRENRTNQSTCPRPPPFASKTYRCAGTWTRLSKASTVPPVRVARARAQGLPGGLLHVLFHHGERFLDLLDVVRSTRATLASHADAKATRTRYQGTARRTAGVHDRVHGENGSDSDSDDNDASHQDDARRGARAGGDGGRGVGGGVGGGGGGSSVRGGPSRKRGAPVVDVDAAVPVGDGDAEGGGDGPARKKVTLVVDADAEMRRAAGASPAAAAPADPAADPTAAPAADPPPRSAAAAPAAASVPPPEGGGREAGGGSSASQGKRLWSVRPRVRELS